VEGGVEAGDGGEVGAAMDDAVAGGVDLARGEDRLQLAAQLRRAGVARADDRIFLVEHPPRTRRG
jgi:hypothetical protein